MSTGEGPARNTRASARAARREQMRARQSTPPREEAQAPEPPEAPAQPDTSLIIEESILTSVAEPSSVETEQSERSSDHGTIRDIPEETYEPDQSYTTAPSLSADPEGFVSSTPAVAADKGKGRAYSTPPRSEGNASPWGREPPPQLSHANEEWAQIDSALNNWSAMAEKSKKDAIKHRQELSDLQTKIINSYHRASDTSSAMQGIRKMFDQVRARYEDQRVPSPSPRALATQAIYAERGSNEGTADYKHRRSAQARFDQPQPIEQIGVEEIESNTPAPRAPEKRSAAQMTSEERFAQSMTQFRARAAAKTRPRVRTTGPPIQIQGPGGGDPEGDPSDSDGDNIPKELDDLGPQGPHRDSLKDQVPRTIGSPMEDSTDRTRLEHNVLDRDYARRARSQSQQLVGPIVSPAPRQGQAVAPITQRASVQGQADMDHETLMIESLREHIRTTLMGVPDNLPELKGLRARMPDAYEGEDDFDRLERWLHGLLRFMKIHRLTGVDKDMDRILVTGTSLRGRAERWFGQEVEHPKRLVRDWTFESVVVGLYRVFITTATSQKAMQQYMNIQYTQEEGINAFYNELLMWAGRLAEYPDVYSFKRRIFRSLPSEFHRHLTLYDGITPEMSTIDAIVRQTQHLEQTLTSLRVGRRTDRQLEQGALTVTKSGPQRPTRQRDDQRYQRPRKSTDRRQQRRLSADNERRNQPNTPNSISGDRRKHAPTISSTPKGDTSKMTCYKCGRIGHIANDPKCPQYKKSERRQMYATQVVDDRSESEMPDQGNINPQGNQSDAPVPESGESQDEEQDARPNENDSLDGSQYEGEQSSSEDYDDSSLHSEDVEPIYI